MQEITKFAGLKSCTAVRSKEVDSEIYSLMLWKLRMSWHSGLKETSWKDEKRQRHLKMWSLLSRCLCPCLFLLSLYLSLCVSKPDKGSSRCGHCLVAGFSAACTSPSPSGTEKLWYSLGLHNFHFFSNSNSQFSLSPPAWLRLYSYFVSDTTTMISGEKGTWASLLRWFYLHNVNILHGV